MKYNTKAYTIQKHTQYKSKHKYFIIILYSHSHHTKVIVINYGYYFCNINQPRTRSAKTEPNLRQKFAAFAKHAYIIMLVLGTCLATFVLMSRLHALMITDPVTREAIELLPS